MIGRRIKAYLDDCGIKYTRISEKTGIPINILSPMLNGKREIKAEEYICICRALELPLEMFAGDYKVLEKDV